MMDKETLSARFDRLSERISYCQERIIYFEDKKEMLIAEQEEIEILLSEFDERPIADWD